MQIRNLAAHRLGATLLAGAAVFFTVSCQESHAVPADAPGVAMPGEGQQTFDTPEAAVQALQDAVNNPDKGGMHQLFGPSLSDLVSGDPVEDKNAYENFARKAKEKITLESKSDTEKIIRIGNDGWPFAIPIVQDADGKWYFDTVAGKDEILARRIGRNELATIATMHDYVQAQREYASKDRDGSGVLKFAQRLVSHPGQKDGLYWQSSDDSDQSPFGPLAADAEGQGYGPVSGSRKNPVAYHGYYFHILKTQGPAAPGGAYNYVINGNMIAGFALVAAPAEYGQSGVMTFIVSHQGKVYQKDFGKKTSEMFKTMTTYNPDSTWTLVTE
jgi:hypothetical protein